MTGPDVLDEHVDGLSHTFRISVDADEIRAAVQAKLKEIGHTATIPGFRPGRAPLTVLSNRYGERVRAAAVDHMAIDIARRLIAQRGLKPSCRPKIHVDADFTTSSGSVSFTLLLEVMPEVVLGSLEGFRLKKLRVPAENSGLVEQADVYLRRQLFDALLARHDFPVSQDMVENEYKRIRLGFDAEVGEAVDEALDVELRRIAERRIQLAILLMEIGRKHDIHVQRADVEELIKRQIERDPEHEDEIIDYYLDHPTAVAELQSPLFENRVVDFLLARSEIEMVEQSAEELRHTLDQL